ncbi:guanine nucleotide-binding protein G(o) subunit alpha-like [Salvelinus fontinalis]|uniref:guanine nucleotide-binding protein G(o) subunit alpha-like n=1 Tax=Salvelinus fontinalis TaxID=8038 RepID=UPI0024850527|nr:guanine nucleotide-binding protein G(o) subunit alpha-like [Salvelinus fontinalis]
MFRFFNILPAPLQMCVRSICIHPVPDVTEDEKRAKIQNSNIERDLFEQAKLEVNVIKILLLGATESGKSTMVKQMKIIHSHGFSKPELISFKAAVLDNLLTSLKFVLRGMGLLRIHLANKKNKAHARAVLSCGQCFGEDGELLPFVALSFCALWADQGVRAAAARGYEFQLNDSALYFFENISRIISPRYIPTEADVLRVRVRTSGIIETRFPVNHMVFRMYDVGGQRTKRRKWLSYFDCVRAVLFVVALSDYDMTLMEDRSMNRLQESLELFTSICTNIVFRSTSLILLMNKSDLFQEKILNSGRHLRLYFPSYKGADWDVDAASRHITAMFVACNKTPNKLVFHHYTTATDTHNVRVVFHVVMDTIVKENLEAVPLL